MKSLCPLSWSIRTFSPLFLIPLIIVLLYANTLKAPFHFDDRDLIQKNPAIQDLTDPHRAIAYNQQRPLLMLSLALSYHFSRVNVFGYHLFNILLHSLSAIALFSLCAYLLRARGRASWPGRAGGAVFLAVLFYAAQPLDTEAITYISGRSSLLASFFLLVSFVFYAKSWRRPSLKSGISFAVMAFLAYCLSLASKEIGVVLPVLLLGADYYFFFLSQGKKDRATPGFRNYVKARGPYLLPFFCMIAALFAIRYHLQGAFLEKNSAFFVEHPGGSYGFTQLNVVPWYYIRKLFFPAGQNVDIDFPIYRSFFNPSTLLGAGGIFILVLFAIRKRLSSVWIFYAVFWFFMALCPTSSFIPITDVAVERRLYLPGMALTFFLLHFFSKPRRPPRLLLLAATLLCFSTQTIDRNAVFREEKVLWQDAVAKSPHKPRPHNNLGDIYNGLGRLDAAVTELRTAVRLEPRYAKAHYNLGVVYGRMGRKQDAFREFKTAGLLHLSSAGLHYNLGVLYADFGFPGKAVP